MLDSQSGQVACANLSFGGFMEMGGKLFAVPWNLLRLDTANKRFVLDVDQARLSSAPGFDKDDWPDMQDPTLGGIYLLIMKPRQSKIPYPD